MGEFLIRTADWNVAVSAEYKTTRLFCKDYLCEGQPDFPVEIIPEDIVLERQYSAREDARQGLVVRNHSDAYMEAIALLRKISEKFIEYDTLLFHWSVVAVDGAAYLFTAPIEEAFSVRISESGVFLCDGKRAYNKPIHANQ